MKKIFSLIILTIFFGFININMVNAETVTLYGSSLGNYFHAKYENGYYSKFGQILDYRVANTNQKAYCIAPAESFSSGSSYNVYTLNDSNILDYINDTQSRENNKLTQEQLNMISMIAYYGYGYANHTSNDYILATQMLIYRVIENQVFTNKNCIGGNCSKIDDPVGVSLAMQEIQNLVDKHFVLPSFNNNTYNFSLGETLQIEDENGVLDNFAVESCVNCTAYISNNTLYVTPSGSGELQLTLAKGNNTYNNDTLFFTSNRSQNMIAPGNLDPVYARIRGSVVGGDVEVYKKDENGKSLENVEFKVYNSLSEEVCTILTDQNGYGKCENLSNGNYTIKEVSTNEGYIIDDRIYNFSITNETKYIKFNFENSLIRGNVELYKVSESEDSDATLEGAIYGIYDLSNNLVAELTVNSDGYAKYENLKYGDYYLKEIKASVGHELDTNIYNFSVKNNGETIKITSIEPVRHFKFTLIKTMGDGASGVVETEANAIFDIYLISTNKKVATIKTNSKGKADIDLPYGKYRVCQISGNSNTLLADCFEIDLTKHDVEKVVNNELLKAKLKVIKVDSETNQTIPLAGIKFKIKNLDTDEYVCQVTDKEQCIFTTDENGVLITPLPLIAGRYQLEEVDQNLDGYLWNDEPLTFTINSGNISYNDTYGAIVEVSFANTPVFGEIIINKAYEDLVENLPTTIFGLYANEDIYYNNQLIYHKHDLVAEVTTDSNGYAKISNLYLGDYYIKELATDDKYVLDAELHYVSLKYQDQYTATIVYEFNIENKIKRGNLIVLKTDADTSEALSGAIFSIYDMNDKLVYTGTTEDGKLEVLNLKYGKYYLVEEQAPDGYILNNERHYFEIKEEDSIIEINVSNDQIIKVPKTGLSDSKILNVIGVIVILLGVGYIAYDKFKKR